MKIKLLLPSCLPAFLLVSEVMLILVMSINDSYACCYVRYPGSDVTINTSTGRPVDDLGTKNYDPEKHDHHGPAVISGNIVHDGSVVGSIDSSGDIRTSNGQSITIDREGLVTRNGNIIGTIDSSGDLKERNGRTVSIDRSNGMITEDGNIIGSVSSSGDITDRHGNTITTPEGATTQGTLMLLQKCKADHSC